MHSRSRPKSIACVSATWRRGGLIASGGRIAITPEVMTAHRLHAANVWANRSLEERQLDELATVLWLASHAPATRERDIWRTKGAAIVTALNAKAGQAERRVETLKADVRHSASVVRCLEASQLERAEAHEAQTQLLSSLALERDRLANEIVAIRATRSFRLATGLSRVRRPWSEQHR